MKNLCKTWVSVHYGSALRFVLLFVCQVGAKSKILISLFSGVILYGSKLKHFTLIPDSHLWYLNFTLTTLKKSTPNHIIETIPITVRCLRARSPRRSTAATWWSGACSLRNCCSRPAHAPRRCSGPCSALPSRHATCRLPARTADPWDGGRITTDCHRRHTLSRFKPGFHGLSLYK